MNPTIMIMMAGLSMAGTVLEYGCYLVVGLAALKYLRTPAHD